MGSYSAAYYKVNATRAVALLNLLDGL